MPELPEVESVRRGADRWFLGRTIEHASVTHPRAVRRHVGGADDFVARIVGNSLIRSARRGKYWWYELSDGGTLVIQLGMSGQILVGEASETRHPHERIRFDFADKVSPMQFRDQRTFGGMYVDECDEHGIPISVQHIARDPLDPLFDTTATVKAIRRRNSPVKAVLLDQSVISGVGNIYADEALWRARLHWSRPAASLSTKKVTELVGHAHAVMSEALAAGGTSFDSLYVNVNGTSGYFSRSLAAYGRNGEPCMRCSSFIVRQRFANRSSYTCPRCQRQPRSLPRT